MTDRRGWQQVDVLLARQPIFNRANEVYGYELLYRNSYENFYTGTDDNRATAELINNAYLLTQLADISGGKKVFINFSEDLLVEEIPTLMPKEDIVIEILETVKPTPRVIKACKNLKRYGYTLALDDFVYSPEFEPLIELVDIIKLEFTMEKHKQEMIINRYKNNKLFLAERIETREEYEEAHAMGYHFFQGYFFSKPVIVSGEKEMKFNPVLLQMIAAIDDKYFDYQKATQIIERDVGLSYQLLKLVNTVGREAIYEIYSIKQALVRLGIDEIRKWLYVLLLQQVEAKELNELVANSLVRAKFMEQVAKHAKMSKKHLELFMLGLFSNIDKVLNKPMADCLDEIQLSRDVRQALLGVDNELTKILTCVEHFERGEWDILSERCSFINEDDVMDQYIKAIKWANEIKTHLK